MLQNNLTALPVRRNFKFRRTKPLIYTYINSPVHRTGNRELYCEGLKISREFRRICQKYRENFVRFVKNIASISSNMSKISRAFHLICNK